jgi:hypothetical protein
MASQTLTKSEAQVRSMIATDVPKRSKCIFFGRRSSVMIVKRDY